jgi:hypothetical protein
MAHGGRGTKARQPFIDVESICNLSFQELSRSLIGPYIGPVQGEQDGQRLTVGGLIHLKAIERDHAIKSAKSASQTSTTAAHGAKQRPSAS